MDGEIKLRGRLKGSQRMRMMRLLDMPYKPSELAEEIGFERRQIYRAYIPSGCPHKRDEQRHIWINGKEFREWYEETYPRGSLGKDEAFCLTCKKAVKLLNPIRNQKGQLQYWISACPKCGRKLARIITKVNQEK